MSVRRFVDDLGCRVVWWQIALFFENLQKFRNFCPSVLGHTFMYTCTGIHREKAVNIASLGLYYAAFTGGTTIFTVIINFQTSAEVSNSVQLLQSADSLAQRRKEGFLISGVSIMLERANLLPEAPCCGRNSLMR